MAARRSLNRIPHFAAPLKHTVTPPSIPLRPSQLLSAPFLTRSYPTTPFSSISTSQYGRNTLYTPTACPIPRYSPTRNFSTSTSRPRDHYFDTLKFVQRLQEEGFTQEQSVAMMKVLSDVIEESVTNLTRTLVPKEEQEKITYTRMSAAPAVLCEQVSNTPKQRKSTLRNYVPTYKPTTPSNTHPRARSTSGCRVKLQSSTRACGKRFCVRKTASS